MPASTSPWYTLFFSLLMGLICSLLLTGSAKFAEPYKEANKEAEKVRNILNVLGVTVEKKTSNAQIVAMFKKDVEEGTKGSLQYYKYTSASAGELIAFPFVGPGVWGPIKGLLSLKSDMQTINGITFYEQEETPGLGAEIATPRFQDQFAGKSILSEDGSAGIRITRGGGASKKNEVDGISGATMTGDKVQLMLGSLCKQIKTEWK